MTGSYRPNIADRARRQATIIVDPKALASYAVLIPGVTNQRKDGSWIRVEEAHRQGNAVATKFLVGTNTASATRWVRIPLRSMSLFPGYMVGLVPF